MAGFNNFQSGFNQGSLQGQPNIGQPPQSGQQDIGQSWAGGMRNIFGSPFGQQGGFGSFGQQGGFGSFGQQSGFNPFGGGQQNPWGNFGGQFGGWGGGQQNPWGQMFGLPYGNIGSGQQNLSGNNGLAFGNGTQFGGQTNTVGLQQQQSGPYVGPEAYGFPSYAEQARQQQANPSPYFKVGGMQQPNSGFGSNNIFQTQQLQNSPLAVTPEQRIQLQHTQLSGPYIGQQPGSTTDRSQRLGENTSPNTIGMQQPNIGQQPGNAFGSGGLQWDRNNPRYQATSPETRRDLLNAQF